MQMTEYYRHRMNDLYSELRNAKLNIRDVAQKTYDWMESDVFGTSNEGDVQFRFFKIRSLAHGMVGCILNLKERTLQNLSDSEMRLLVMDLSDWIYSLKEMGEAREDSGSLALAGKLNDLCDAISFALHISKKIDMINSGE